MACVHFLAFSTLMTSFLVGCRPPNKNDSSALSSSKKYEEVGPCESAVFRSQIKVGTGDPLEDGLSYKISKIPITKGVLGKRQWTDQMGLTIWDKNKRLIKEIELKPGDASIFPVITTIAGDHQSPIKPGDDTSNNTNLFEWSEGTSKITVFIKDRGWWKFGVSISHESVWNNSKVMRESVLAECVF